MMSEERLNRPELIIGLVRPLGIPLDKIEAEIQYQLGRFGYVVETIVISALLQHSTHWIAEPDKTERDRVEHQQRHALALRKDGGAEVLARAAIAEIRRRRMSKSMNPNVLAGSVAYLLYDLKHPSEIATLRNVYGSSFVVIAPHAPETSRIEWLAKSMAVHADRTEPDATMLNDAQALVVNDDKQQQLESGFERLGQSTRDTHPLADYFVDASNGGEVSLSRFFDLLFANPTISPTYGEIAMNQAYAVSLRSSDERRQVGAVIVRTFAEKAHGFEKDSAIIASGANEVPRRGGGYYWEGDSPDCRDQSMKQQNQGKDVEAGIKLDAAREIVGLMKKSGWLASKFELEDDVPLGARLFDLLKDTQFGNISEFMRQVHAEMAAIVDAAIRGVPLRGTEMYVTTFPCHGCAKHIIAAGLRRVVYLEPYPKSRATMLHGDEMVVDDYDPNPRGDYKVQFVPFSGVAPRQFARFFSMRTRGWKNARGLDKWRDDLEKLEPVGVVPRADLSYTALECEEERKLPASYQWEMERSHTPPT